MDARWSNFYFLIGSASAGLIGLMFVVVTLTAGRERASSLRGVALYSTPTVVHFAVVFAVSAVTLVPAITVREGAIAFGLIALAGLACALRSAIGIVRAPSHLQPPHWSDFWLYGGLPVVLYLALVAVAAGVWADAAWTARAMAGVLLALLLLAIRNAWDTITWIAPRADAGD
ncbi:MAG TPA: hypothetical protein VIJ59_08870 [Caulobacteraceae bacterium]